MLRTMVMSLLIAPLLVGPAAAQAVWRMETEYPANSMPGEGLATFATLVREGTAGALQIEPIFDAGAGIRSADTVRAVRDGRLEAADAFAPTLAVLDPVFALSALPFRASTVADAQRLADRARPLYERALAAAGQRLLYVTPWPPTGLWSKRPLAGAADLQALTVRTYDAASERVFAGAGAKAVNLSFADTMPRLRDGSVDAVLSSGDGGAGRKLWEVLPHFTDIAYAMPVSVAFVGTAEFERLPEPARNAVLSAAAETERRQWQAIERRAAENREQLRQHGVTVDGSPDPAILAALRAGAEPIVAEWRRTAGPDAVRLLGDPR